MDSQKTREPRKGGRYEIDKKTGRPVLVERTLSPEEAAAAKKTETKAGEKAKDEQ